MTGREDLSRSEAHSQPEGLAPPASAERATSGEGSSLGTVLLLLADADHDRDRAAEHAVQMATAWAREGRRIVLADLHLDDPRLHRALGAPNLEGIVDIFLYGASLARIALPVREGAFYLIPAGTYTPDPGALYRHERWEKLAAGFRDTGATLVLFAPRDEVDLRSMARWGSAAFLLGGEAEPELLARLGEAGIELLGRADLSGSRRQEGVASPAPPLADARTEEPRGGSAMPAGGSEFDDWPEGTSAPDFLPASPGTLEGADAGDRHTSRGGEGSGEGPSDEPHGSSINPEAEAAPSSVGVSVPALEPADPVVAALGSLDFDLALPPPAVRPRPAGSRLPLLLGGGFLLFLALLIGVYLLFALRPELLGRSPDLPEAVLPDSSLLQPVPRRAGVLLPYSVQVRAFTSFAAARAEAEREQRRLGSISLYISPEEIQGILYYRIMAGLSSDTLGARQIRDRLVELGSIDPRDAAGSWSLLHFAPLAFDLGEYPSPEAAAVRADSLQAYEIPTYRTEIPYSDGSRRWQLYGGAFRDSIGAAAMGRLLSEAGLEVPLVTRSGIPAILPE